MANVYTEFSTNDEQLDNRVLELAACIGASPDAPKTVWSSEVEDLGDGYKLLVTGVNASRKRCIRTGDNERNRRNWVLYAPDDEDPNGVVIISAGYVTSGWRSAANAAHINHYVDNK